ncbi:arsenate reductase (glutaredoxin) [Hahella aquimaris]|uniref:arsenate reductase (glutaredoxin) n=1 Tax=Hahella sp. HNIBRBA332 TaxID=3015983 RepID=UPI00273C6725|nr:arsenate reductase (glutaredoxin) [Hahella sp. HNIBRBA332]WLQ11463.1 arsenate reductase (glutaredoxin) [Hahella sp. HNIBRBA332]
MSKSTLTIWHNPRCSKSRQTLQIIEDSGAAPTIVKYLETPPNAEELKAALAKLGISARDLLRKGEDEYKTLNLANADLSEDALIDAMVAHPKLIERPVVIKGDRAVLGRPPENVNELL